jgi:hypothetical protein
MNADSKLDMLLRALGVLAGLAIGYLLSVWLMP